MKVTFGIQGEPVTVPVLVPNAVVFDYIEIRDELDRPIVRIPLHTHETGYHTICRRDSGEIDQLSMEGL